MHVVQLLLPLFDNDGCPFPAETMRGIREDLITRFGGVTAFSRAPADGVWSDNGRRIRDQVILVEVMVATLDRDWWRGFRTSLEEALRQDSVVIRTFAVERL